MKNKLSQQTYKCLANNIGEAAALEIKHMLDDLAAEVEHLRRTKVTVTPITPVSPDQVKSPHA